MIEPAVDVQCEGPVHTLTLNRPARRNALDLADRRELLAALRESGQDPECRAIVLTGAGEVFCAGGDIRSMSQDPDVARERLAVVNDVARALVCSAKPVVAAVRGGAYGLGLGLAAACDYVVAAEDARFVASFAKIGLTADSGLSWSLAQRVGPARAKELILFAEDLDATEARRIGLVSEIVEGEKVAVRARERAERLAAASPPWSPPPSGSSPRRRRTWTRSSTRRPRRRSNCSAVRASWRAGPRSWNAAARSSRPEPTARTRTRIRMRSVCVRKARTRTGSRNERRTHASPRGVPLPSS